MIWVEDTKQDLDVVFNVYILKFVKSYFKI